MGICSMAWKSRTRRSMILLLKKRQKRLKQLSHRARRLELLPRGIPRRHKVALHEDRTQGEILHQLPADQAAHCNSLYNSHRPRIEDPEEHRQFPLHHEAHKHPSSNNPLDQTNPDPKCPHPQSTYTSLPGPESQTPFTPPRIRPSASLRHSQTKPQQLHPRTPLKLAQPASSHPAPQNSSKPPTPPHPSPTSPPSTRTSTLPYPKKSVHQV
jgi:hypothetical protein